MVDSLNSDWIRGYTQALMDLETHLHETIEEFRSRRKPFTKNRMLEFVSVFIRNRAALREHRRGFIRLNVRTNKLEFFDPDAQEASHAVSD